jgi:hypothetical protein
MRLSRTDIFPALLIVAGAALGPLLVLSPLLLFGPSDDAPVILQLEWSSSAPPPPPARPVTGRAVAVWSSNGTSVVYEDANGYVYRVNSGGGVPELVQTPPDER